MAVSVTCSTPNIRLCVGRCWTSFTRRTSTRYGVSCFFLFCIFGSLTCVYCAQEHDKMREEANQLWDRYDAMWDTIYLGVYMDDSEENRENLALAVEAVCRAWLAGYTKKSGSGSKSKYPHELIWHLPDCIRIWGLDPNAYSCEGWEHGNKHRKTDVRHHSNMLPTQRTNTTMARDILKSYVHSNLQRSELGDMRTQQERVKNARKVRRDRVKQELASKELVPCAFVFCKAAQVPAITSGAPLSTPRRGSGTTLTSPGPDSARVTPRGRQRRNPPSPQKPKKPRKARKKQTANKYNGGG